MFKFFEFRKISLGDVIETLGIVLTRPWKMSSAVFQGGGVLEAAVLFYLCMLASAALLVLWPFNLGDEFPAFAQAATLASLVILGVTSVTFFWGLRLCGVPISFQKVLTINCFLSGASLLVLALCVALATSVITLFYPVEKQDFAALTIGCFQIIELSPSGPVFVAPAFGLHIHIAISLLHYSYYLYLFGGVLMGLAPYRTVNVFSYCSVALALVLLELFLAASFSGLQIDQSSAFCKQAIEASNSPAGLRPHIENLGS